MIFLEAPGQSSDPSMQKGYFLRHDVWSPVAHRFHTFDDVCCSFQGEVAARLVVLKHLLQSPDNRLTPLLWLLFTMSELDAKRIGSIRDASVDRGYLISNTQVNNLVSEVTNLVASRPVNALEGLHCLQKPILVADELQVLESRKVTSVGEPAGMSLMRAVVDAASSFSVPAIWSGTRMTVMTSMSDTSAFAKHCSTHGDSTWWVITST